MAVHRLTSSLNALRDLREHGPESIEDGICINVILRGSGYSLPRQLLASWPGSMDPTGCYPVEGDYTSFYQDVRAGTLWQNPRRSELLDWLIATLEKELQHE